MTGAVYDLTFDEASLFADIVSRLTNPGSAEIRETIFPDILRLMRSEVLASFIWNPKSNSYQDPFVINQSLDNIKAYRSWYQYRDPMTRQLRSLWRPAYVDEVICRSDLRKTEFFNDFLMKDGLDHGINLFLNIGGRELADLRIWRTKRQPDFADREIGLLKVLSPLLKRALSASPDITLSVLTERERDVALLVSRGCSDKDIGRVLNIGFATVRTHLSRCLEKIGCSNRAELAAYVTRLSQ
ncbi:DNA-binding CsgD family transcriptional regulator [Neorhizobium galegae]|jgi:DNA-binding CsgD family transcriptional regulator|uniref:helix-turn-helix transcriptional regulator n=1 Tax=Neorhizobium galegae TaxID=399 RepID=UPI002789F133|nr:LuxR C-terminal-related transcriptional regulator [Neorhizobium galegae]MDQ0137818.1 DNA-binding CsgD family transcriptional regulator [Neorhizobium galegae]